jgi:hypothetical protein
MVMANPEAARAQEQRLRRDIQSIVEARTP